MDTIQRYPYGSITLSNMTQVTTPSSRARTAKPQGQWAIDGTTPLNHAEEVKQEADGLSVHQRILDVYSKQGFGSISEDDLFQRMKWAGVYTQRRQDIDGHRTATLTTAELTDEYFMMRIRIDGGALTTHQLRVIAGISNEFGRGTADITDRQNIQIHWIAIEDIPEIWRRLEQIDLSTTTACGDAPRVILGSPVAGIAADEIIDPTPVIDEIRRRFVGNPEFSNLPRKYKSAVTGHPSLDVVHEINDISLVGVVHPELGPGYDLWVGGGLSTNPRLAERLGAFVSEERAADVWAGVTGIFRDYGYRRNRARARLKFLLADWGPEKFRQVLQDEYLGYELPDGPAPEPASGSPLPGDHVGVHDQKDGRKYVGFAGKVGRVDGDRLARFADLAEAAGSTRVRLTPHQKMIVLDVDPDRVEELIDAMRPLEMDARPGPFQRSTMACTGIEYCKLAFVETKGLAARAIDELERRFAHRDDVPPIQLNLNGCPNSCARIQTADIGLKGQILKGEFGFQVHLGGGLASADRDDAGLGRTVRGLKVTSEDLVDYVERVVTRFLDQRERGQTFAEWAHETDEENLK